MPSLAYVENNLYCTTCKELFDSNYQLTAFAWGYCSGYSPKKGYIYQISDSIRWRSCDGLPPPSWASFSDTLGYNFGDPTIKNLIVRDTSILWFHGYNCKKCGQFFAGAAVKIIDNKIEHVWAYKIGELDNETDHYLINSNGELEPKPNWLDNMPLKKIKNC